MKKLFAAVAAVLGFVAVGTALTAEVYSSGNSPAQAEASGPEARYPITCDVIDGRLSLLEAASAFRDLNRQSPALAEALSEAYPGDTEGERACQQVLAFVRAELQGRSKGPQAEQAGEAPTNSAAAVLARLQAEWEAAQDKDGKVHLSGDAS